MVGVEISLKKILITSFYTTAIAVFISGHPVHMEDRKARSENDITPSTSDTLISWSVITVSAPSERTEEPFLLLNGKAQKVCYSCSSLLARLSWRESFCILMILNFNLQQQRLLAVSLNRFGCCDFSTLPMKKCPGSMGDFVRHFIYLFKFNVEIKDVVCCTV